ncbi:MAG TPA: hypothetical protein VN980_18175 [Alphaproteobacteria bacterium]|nr:hypothetical protein [Alphaproteobacteria bacterium]
MAPAIEIKYGLPAPAEAKVLSRDGKVLAHGTSTVMVSAGAK